MKPPIILRAFSRFRDLLTLISSSGHKITKTLNPTKNPFRPFGDRISDKDHSVKLFCTGLHFDSQFIKNVNDLTKSIMNFKAFFIILVVAVALMWIRTI